MVKKNNRIGVLIAWSFFYAMMCSAFTYLLCKYGGIEHKHQIIIISDISLSILIWFVLLWGFTKYDGSNNKWWSKFLCHLYPYPEIKRRTLFLDVVLPTFLWSFLSILFPFIFFCLLWFVCSIICIVGYIFLYNPIEFLLHNCQVGLLSLILLVTFLMILSIIHYNELKRLNIRYNRLALLRTLFCLNIYTIGYLILVTGIVEGCFDIISVIHAYKSDNFGLVQLGTGLFKPYVNLLPGALLLYYCRRNLNFLLYTENDYYLYLRSFLFDEKEDYLMTLLPTGGKQIMKIGNPSNSLFSNFFSDRTIYHDILYLPSSNWQKHLDYYIYRAYSIISVVDDTQGVVWEMFHHSEYYNKIVFYVDSNEKLNNLEKIISESTEFESSTRLCYCINKLNKRKMSTPFIFWIKDDRCYYEMNVSIVSTLLSTKLNYLSEYFFDIDTNLESNKMEENTKEKAYYKDWSNLSRLVLKICWVFKSINTILPCGLFAFAILCSFLFCIMLMIGVVWFGLESIFKGDVITGITAVILVIGILTLSVYGWYKEIAKGTRADH